ncbi:hypothetical protein HJG60_017889 [Phyllostomus discolor]|uniref:Uncharacterized protein n=1 Tax=Phyllostomus discolor TaxID=89673 RepID=A0A834DTC3_9CHIR|nr:hypothetical protein HJG60_017889 [Phyllostomus discolor]
MLPNQVQHRMMLENTVAPSPETECQEPSSFRTSGSQNGHSHLRLDEHVLEFSDFASRLRLAFWAGRGSHGAFGRIIQLFPDSCSHGSFCCCFSSCRGLFLQNNNLVDRTLSFPQRSSWLTQWLVHCHHACHIPEPKGES